MAEPTDAPGADGLEVHVLGALQVLVDGRPVELGPTRRRTLLAALVVDANRVIPLDVLADRVWDEHPPASAAGTVHAYVSRLRSSVVRYAADGSALPSPLITRSPGYLLRLEPQSLDVHRFLAGVDRAQGLLRGGDAAGAYSTVTTALALWRDEHAYADIPAQFVEPERDRLAEARVAAHELAVETGLQLGMHEQLVPRLVELLRAHPLRENLHTMTMLALYRSGRQADALAQFTSLRETLLDELGVDPGPPARLMHERILRQDPALAAPAARTTAAAPAAPKAMPVAGARLVGRTRELHRLATLLSRVEHEATPAVAAVVGEAGIGKTRLVEEAVSAAGGAVVAWGRCWQHEGAPALWPWVQALTALVEQLPPDVVAAGLTGRGAGVAALLPDVEAADHTVQPETTGSGVDSVRIYDAVAQFLSTVAAHPATPPVVVALDDMQWADLGSRELTEFVVSHVRAGKLALLLTVRTPTEDSSRSGTELLASLTRSGRAERIDLAGLTPAAVNDYVADRTGSRLDDPTAAALADRTGGNPFFVSEVVRLLVTDSDTDSDDGQADATSLTSTVPDSVREVIGRRLSRLPETDQLVLRVAAVVGRTFDLDLLVGAARLDEDAVDEAIDRATGLGIVCSEPSDPSRHRFVHALTQQTLLETTGPARVRRLHGRVAYELEQSGAAVTPAAAEQLAYHLACSGGEDEVARAVDLCLHAAQQAVDRGAYPMGEALLLRALDLAARLDGDAGARKETAARVRLWLLYCMLGGPTTPEARGQHERAVELVRRHGEPGEILIAHQAQLSRTIWRDDLAGADRLVEEMQHAADAAPDEPLLGVAVRLGRGQIAVHRMQLDAALAEYAELMAAPDSLAGAPEGVFPIHPAYAAPLWQAIAFTLAGRHDEAARGVEYLDRSLEDAAGPTTAYVRIMLATRASMVDDPAETCRYAEAALVLVREHGLLDAETFLRPLLHWAEERLQPGSALAAMQAALDVLAAAPTMALRPHLLGLLADVYLRAGDESSALRVADAALAEAAASGDLIGHDRVQQIRA